MQKYLKMQAVKSSLALLLVAGSIQLMPNAALAESVVETPVLLTIGDADVELGTSLSIPIKVTPNGEIASYNMQIDFDPKVFKIKEINPKYGGTVLSGCLNSEEGCFQASFDNDAGWIRTAWIDMTTGTNVEHEHPITEEKVLFEIVVEAKSEATASEFQIVDQENKESLSFTDGKFIDNMPHQREVKFVRGRLSAYHKSENASPPTDVLVYIDGKLQEKSASAATTTINNQVVTTITVDNKKVTELIEANTIKKLMLPIHSTKANIVIGELNGKLVKAMEGKEASVEIQTDLATYTLPASQIRIDNISNAIGKDIALEDIKISLKIAETPLDQTGGVESAARSGHFELIAKPVDFVLEASYGDKKVIVHQFNDYVVRSLVLPEGVDPAKMTTGVVANEDGSLTHVPTKIRKENETYFADIKSLTNSTYSVIWNPKSFQDVTTHWSKVDVNDLASRLIVQGSSEDQFSPDRSITRAEFTTIMLRALGLHSPKDSQNISFSDISSADWYAQDVKTAVSYGLISGYDDGTFMPNGQITRAEAMVIIDRAMSIVHLENVKTASAAIETLSSFTDGATIADWASQAIASAVKQGIAQGADNKLAPSENITRAETATMIRRMLIKAGLINA
ncbi:S-layer homology domain-containing protein [Paenibacillus sp. LjRoot153]|uniref:S-layer homology domain-containing protein n=1 Tax=Paenibacillus sp. LjRoot153 TaxID=3342270 RepID=UPI003ED126DB